MRIMKNSSGSFKVVKHIVTKGFWEFYIIDNGMYKSDNDIQFAFVRGNFNEFGDISIKEIEPFIMSESTNLKNILPAPGFHWKESSSKKQCTNCKAPLTGAMIFHPKLCLSCVVELETDGVVLNYLELAKRSRNAKSTSTKSPA